jgi:hypothetical protein
MLAVYLAQMLQLGEGMTIRTRKLIGTIALLMFIAVYAFLAMLVAVVLQVSGNKVVELLFYLVGGLAWVLPAAWLVRWMQKPDAGAAG